MSKPYYVYLLRCTDGSLYAGITTDVKRRFLEHLAGGNKGAKYTKTHTPKEWRRCGRRKTVLRHQSWSGS